MVGSADDIYAKATHPEMANEEASLPPAVRSVDQGSVRPAGKHVVEHSGIGGEKSKGRSEGGGGGGKHSLASGLLKGGRCAETAEIGRDRRGQRPP